MVTWFAGLFYLPRLYVYHAQANDQISKDRFKIMERKLFWGIMTPGAVPDNIIWSSVNRVSWHVLLVENEDNLGVSISSISFLVWCLARKI